MSALSDHKQALLAQTADRWEKAVQGARRLLTYDRARDHGPDFEDCREEDTAVRALAYRMFTCRRHTLFEVLGGVESGFGIKLNGYCADVPHGSVVRLMDFVGFFISHELLDDGIPGIGYYRNTLGDEERSSNTFVRCGKDHPKAKPYFARDIDVLREEGYDEKPEMLCVQSALDIINRIEKQKDDRKVKIRGHMARLKERAFFDLDDLTALELTEEEKALAKLADEIIALEP